MGSGYVIVTHGAESCVDMLKVTCRREIAWCRKHDMEYRASTRRECMDSGFFWDKLALLQRLAKEYDDGTVFLWKDPDCVIAQVDVSPKGVLPPDKHVAFRWVDNCLANPGVSFWQAGLFFLRLNQQTRDFIDYWYSLRHRSDYSKDDLPPAWDEKALQVALKDTGLAVHPLPKEWNAFRQNEQATAIIKAFHGWSHRRAKEKLQDALCTSVCKIRKEG